jgi:hypothetical protein
MTQGCPVDPVQFHLNDPNHSVVVISLDLFVAMIVAGVAGDEPIEKGKGFWLRKVFGVPLSHVTGVVVALEAVDPAAVVGVADVTGCVDTVGQEKVIPVIDIIWSRNFSVAALTLRQFLVGIDDLDAPTGSGACEKG